MEGLDAYKAGISLDLIAVLVQAKKCSDPKLSPCRAWLTQQQQQQRAHIGDVYFYCDFVRPLSLSLFLCYQLGLEVRKDGSVVVAEEVAERRRSFYVAAAAASRASYILFFFFGNDDRVCEESCGGKGGGADDDLYLKHGRTRSTSHCLEIQRERERGKKERKIYTGLKVKKGGNVASEQFVVIFPQCQRNPGGN